MGIFEKQDLRGLKGKTGECAVVWATGQRIVSYIIKPCVQAERKQVTRQTFLTKLSGFNFFIVITVSF